MPQSKKTPQRQPTENTARTGSELVDIQLIELPEKQQPRRYFSEDKMLQLIASIKEHGILEPLIVRPKSSESYELVAGERRLRAAKRIGLNEVPIIVRDFTDEQAYEVALLENLQRDDLNPIDETEGILYLLCQILQYSSKEEVLSLLNRLANAHRRSIELSYEDNLRKERIDELFLKVGRLNRESFRTNRLPLLNMPEDVLKILREGKLEYTKAKAIAKLPDPEQRQTLMEQAIKSDLSLSKIKDKIAEIQEESKRIKELPLGSWQERPDIRSEPLSSQIQISQEPSPSQAASGQRLKNLLASLLELDASNYETKEKGLTILLTQLENLLKID